jgi:hypothetical protein
VAERLKQLRAELAAVERELVRLSNAIAAGGQLGSLLDALKARERRRDELRASLALQESLEVRRFDRGVIEAGVHEHVSRWRALLTKRVEDGRQLLREVLAGPLRFTPAGRAYRFEGRYRLARSSQDWPRLHPLW